MERCEHGFIYKLEECPHCRKRKDENKSASVLGSKAGKLKRRKEMELKNKKEVDESMGRLNKKVTLELSLGEMSDILDKHASCIDTGQHNAILIDMGFKLLAFPNYE